MLILHCRKNSGEDIAALVIWGFLAFWLMFRVLKKLYLWSNLLLDMYRVLALNLTLWFFACSWHFKAVRRLVKLSL